MLPRVASVLALGVLEPRTYTAPVLAGIPSDSEIRGGPRGSRRRFGGGDATPTSRGPSRGAGTSSSTWWGRSAGGAGPATPRPFGLGIPAQGGRPAGARGRGGAARRGRVRKACFSPFPDNTLRPGAALTRQVVVLLARGGEGGVARPRERGLRGGVRGPDHGDAGRSAGVVSGGRLRPLLPQPRRHARRRVRAHPPRRGQGQLRRGDGVASFLEAEQTWKGAPRTAARATSAGRSASPPGRGESSLCALRQRGQGEGASSPDASGSPGGSSSSPCSERRGGRAQGAPGAVGDGPAREPLRGGPGARPEGPGGAVRDHGRGLGARVGLCQVGAFGIALAGSTHEEILQHYYTGSRSRRRTTDKHPARVARTPHSSYYSRIRVRVR